jgi:hypothetical protein
VGFVVDKVELDQDLSEYFSFSCQFLFHKMLHNCPSFSTDTIYRLVADVPHPTSRKVLPAVLFATMSASEQVIFTEKQN